MWDEPCLETYGDDGDGHFLVLLDDKTAVSLVRYEVHSGIRKSPPMPDPDDEVLP